MKVALTVAGTDSGGGAGVAADLKVFDRLGLWGTCAVTAVTAQNTVGVHAVTVLPGDDVAAQIAAVASDLGPLAAVKTGMLGSASVAAAVASALAGQPNLVVDPVGISKHGDDLMGGALPVLRSELLPLAAVVTPNLPEASALVSCDEPASRDELVEVARAVLALGPGAVLLKGGHLPGGASPDVLVTGQDVVWFDAERIDQLHTHGTGCVLSAAIAGHLALGASLAEACRAAKALVADAIRRAGPLGHGIGPVRP